MSNPAQWETMKKLYRQFRQKYRRLKEKILDRLNGTGLQFLSRSKKLKARTTQAPSEFTTDDEYVDPLLGKTTPSISPFSENNDYDYEYFDSADEVDSFEEIDDTRSICHQIDWNVLYNHSNVFVLTTYIVSEKTVCSLSDIVEDHEYHHVCEYGLSLFPIIRLSNDPFFSTLVSDFCFANILCGTHGQCVNTLSGFKCSCSFLYGGLLCEKSRLISIFQTSGVRQRSLHELSALWSSFQFLKKVHKFWLALRFLLFWPYSQKKQLENLYGASSNALAS